VRSGRWWRGFGGGALSPRARRGIAAAGVGATERGEGVERVGFTEGVGLRFDSLVRLFFFSFFFLHTSLQLNSPYGGSKKQNIFYK